LVNVRPVLPTLTFGRITTVMLSVCPLFIDSGWQVSVTVAVPPVGLAYDVPPLAGVVVTPAPAAAAQVAVPPPVRVADTSTKPASFAGSVNTSRNTTPGAIDGPWFSYDIT